MKTKQSGEWIGYTYRVLDVFPFVQGVLYYAAVEGDNWQETEEMPQPTRFLLAVGEWGKEEAIHRLPERDAAAFFPVEEVFLDEGILYWVFAPLEGRLLAHRLLGSEPIPLEEVRTLLGGIIGHALRLVERGEFAPVDPLNILVTPEGEVRFLYGGSARRLPRPGAGDAAEEEGRMVAGIASLAYRMLTGQSPPAGGEIPSLRSRDDIPASWEWLIRQALSPDPAMRPTLARLEEGFRDGGAGEGTDRQGEAAGPGKRIGAELRGEAESAPPVEDRRPEVSRPVQAVPPEAPPPLHPREMGGSGPAPSRVPPRAGDGALSGVGPERARHFPEPSTIGADPALRSGNGRAGIPPLSEAGGEEAESGFTPQPPAHSRGGDFLFPGESPETNERPGILRRFLSPKMAVAVAVALVVAAAGWGGYAWLVAGEEASSAKSITVFDPDVEEDPEQAAIWYRQSVDARNDKQLAQAILLGRKAVSADPGNRKYYDYLAQLYGMADDHRSAVLLLREAVKRFPDDAPLHDRLAMHAYYAEDLKTAEWASDRSIQLDPDQPRYLYHRGKIFAARGDVQSAAKLIGEAVKRDADNAVYLHDLAVFLFRLKDLEQAVTRAEQAVQYDRSNEKYRMTLGLLYLKKREQVENESELSPTEKKKRLKSLAKRAYESFHAAVRLNHRYAAAHYYEAMSRYYYGDLTGAKQSVERAIALMPDRAAYHYQLAVILTAQNKKAEAIKALEEAVRLEPKNARYKRALDKLRSR